LRAGPHPHALPVLASQTRPARHPQAPLVIVPSDPCRPSPVARSPQPV